VVGDPDAVAADLGGRRGHVLDRRVAVGLLGVHLVIRSRHLAPLRMRVDDRPRVRVGDEAIAKRRRVGGSGFSRSHCAMKCAVNGLTERSSVRLRPDS
jgi:hypothetical protein